MSKPDKSSIISRILNGPLLLFFLTGLYPAIFLASKNWYIYTGRQLQVLLIFSPLGILALGLAVRGLCLALMALYSRLRPSTRLGAIKNKFWFMVAALFSLLVISSLLHSSIFTRTANSYAVFAILAVGAAGMILAVALAGVLPLNLMLLVMVVSAGVSWGQSYRRSQAVEASFWHNQNQAVYDRIKLVKKPNIYLFVLESYHNPEAMKAIYKYDNSSFIDHLGKIDFRVFDRHFSNYSDTLESLSSMMAMQHHYCQLVVGRMDAYGTRDIIGGREYNSTLSILKNNGYLCQYIFDTDYSYKASDLLEYAYPIRTAAKVFGIYQLRPLDDLLALCFENYKGDPFQEIDNINGLNFDAVGKKRIQAAARSSKPYFTVFKPAGVLHTEFTDRYQNLGPWEGKYREMIQTANPDFLGLIDRIVDQDPQAVVIIAGDHGAWRYRGIWQGPGDINQNLKAHGIQGRTLALDIFGAFLAIRYPGGRTEAFKDISHVNVFRTLFSLLAQNTDLLKTKEADNSYIAFDMGHDFYPKYMAVRGDQPLDSWIRIDTDAANDVNTQDAATTTPLAQFQNPDFSQMIGGKLLGWNPEPWNQVKVVPSQETHEGKPVIEITAPAGMTSSLFQVVARGEQLKEGDELAGSIWIKAAEPQVKVLFMIVYLDEKGGEQHDYAIAAHPGDGEWRQLSVKWPYNPRLNVKQVSFMIWADEKIGKPFWAADAQFQFTPKSEQSAAK